MSSDFSGNGDSLVLKQVQMQCVADKGMIGRCYLILWYTNSGIREDNVKRKGNSDTERLNNSFASVYNSI